MKRFLPILTLLCGILAPIASLAADWPRELSPTLPPKVLPALQFEQEGGSVMGLESLRGRFVVLNFWATWCAPCVKEMPSLDRLAGQTNGAVAVLAVSLDNDGLARVPAFFKKHKIKNLAMLADHEKSVWRQLRPRALPLTLILNRKGEEIARVYGDVMWDSPEMVAYVNSLMSKP